MCQQPFLRSLKQHSDADSVQVVRRRELQLVQNQHLLRDPDVKLFAEALEPT